jgi:hypothetical protein
MVPKANNPDAGTRKFIRTIIVVRLTLFIVMTAAIQLDGQHLVMTIKIKDITIHGVLTSEFISAKPSVSEQAPQQLFGISLSHP